MTRFTKVLAVASALLVLPSIAMAISLDIVGVSGAGAGGVLLPGETVTFDLRIDWTGLSTDVYGVSADVTGYDLPDVNFKRDFGLAFAGGTSAAQVLNTGAEVPTFGIITNNDGISNSAGGPQEQYVINNLSPNPYTTNLFGGISASPAAGVGALDVGIGGGLVSNGDTHFQVTFQNVFPAGTVQGATATLNFDLLLLDIVGDAIPTTGDSFTLTVVPEPGTALLMGLGLAGLATIRRR